MRVLFQQLIVLSAVMLSACGGGGGTEPVLSDKYSATQAIREPISPDAQYGALARQSVTLTEPIGTPRGLLVWVHGGGWVLGEKEGQEVMFKLAPMQGIAVLNVEYRIGPDGVFPHSVNDITAVLSALDGKPCPDCTNSPLWERARRYANPGVLISGSSAGGYLAIYAGSQHIQQFPASSVRCITGIVPPVDFRPLADYGAYTVELISGYAAGDMSPQKMADMSPVVQLERGAWDQALTRQWFLAFSQHDQLVPLTTTREFSLKLQSKGAFVHSTDYSDPPDGGHALSMKTSISILQNSLSTCFGLGTM